MGGVAESQLTGGVPPVARIFLAASSPFEGLGGESGALSVQPWGRPRKIMPAMEFITFLLDFIFNVEKRLHGIKEASASIQSHTALTSAMPRAPGRVSK